MSMEDLLHASLSREIAAQQRVEHLEKEIRALKTHAKQLMASLASEKEQRLSTQRELRAATAPPCSHCDNKRWLWYTCGEGTCEMNDPCHECNADEMLPMNWDAL